MLMSKRHQENGSTYKIHTHAHHNETSVNKSILTMCVCIHLHTYHYGNLMTNLEITFVASPFVVNENLHTILVRSLIQHVRNDDKRGTATRMPGSLFIGRFRSVSLLSIIGHVQSQVKQTNKLDQLSGFQLKALVRTTCVPFSKYTCLGSHTQIFTSVDLVGIQTGMQIWKKFPSGSRQAPLEERAPRNGYFQYKDKVR